VLRVSLKDGAELDLFVKHMGPEQPDHPDKQRRDREMMLYEKWLDGEDLPVPRFYGSRWNTWTRRREIFLEHIGDWSLKYQDLEYWFPVAPCLARFHAHFAKRAGELGACRYLLRLDRAYFDAWAGRALKLTADRYPESADDLAAVVDGYGSVAELLERQPATLVHNDLAPKNVLVDRARRPARICFVDWEMAGVGCGLLDLVHLKHGLDPASDRAMCDAYRAELEGTGLLPADGQELRRLFVACELHHTLYRIANSHLWKLPPGRVAEWVADARDLAVRFDANGGRIVTRRAEHGGSA
jgi:Ser/Thr protein kinase RdoA (MazF antagonist)